MSVGWKGKIAFVRRLATGDGRLVSKKQPQRFFSTMNIFKGNIILGGDQSVHYLPLCVDFLLTG